MTTEDQYASEPVSGDPHTELDECGQCHNTPLLGFWRRLRARIAYELFMLMPPPGCRKRYERIWIALLPYVGEWAYSCQCRRVTLAHLHLKD
jgi:hypothetical protein